MAYYDVQRSMGKYKQKYIIPNDGMGWIYCCITTTTTTTYSILSVYIRGFIPFHYLNYQSLVVLFNSIGFLLPLLLYFFIIVVIIIISIIIITTFYDIICIESKFSHQVICYTRFRST